MLGGRFEGGDGHIIRLVLSSFFWNDQSGMKLKHQGWGRRSNRCVGLSLFEQKVAEALETDLMVIIFSHLSLPKKQSD